MGDKEDLVKNDQVEEQKTDEVKPDPLDEQFDTPVQEPTQEIESDVDQERTKRNWLNAKNAAIGAVSIACLAAAGWMMFGGEEESDLTVTNVATAQSEEAKTEEANKEKLKAKVEERIEAAKKDEAKAAEALEEKEVQKFQEKAKKVSPLRQVIDFPFENMKAISAEDGTIMFVSGNGRFVISGTLIDVWQKKELKTMDEIVASSRVVPMKALGLNPDTHGAITLGKGKERVSLFVDPQCGYCHELFIRIQKDDALLKDYAFDFYVVPALGPKSHEMAKKLHMADMTDAKKAEIFRQGAEAFEKLPAVKGPNARGYDQLLMIAQMMGITAVPYIVAPDGRFLEGMPKDIRTFLKATK